MVMMRRRPNSAKRITQASAITGVAPRRRAKWTASRSTAGVLAT